MTVVVPFRSVRRRVPLRAVCSTDESGSTAMAIGSPTSPAPLASVTCWKSSGSRAWAAAGAEVATRPAATSSATAALHRSLDTYRCLVNMGDRSLS